ncbi:MAG: restriction endonuclease subunit S [Polyangiaceae bacterium]|nr:restriction endonuclease subunit S [Polyangiaceae bacterium]
MKRWPSRPLAQCGRLLSGGTPSKSNPDFWGGSLPWFSSKEIRSFELSEAELNVTELGAQNGTNLIPPGTVLFVVRGMSLAKEFRVGVTTVPATFNQDVKAIVPSADVDSRYLTRCLMWLEPMVLSQAEESSHGTKRLPSHIFEELPIPLPPLPEQRRIADILDKADAIRRKRKEAITLTEDLLRSAFLEMVGPRAPGYNEWPEYRLEQLAASIPNAMRTGPFGSDLRHSEFVDSGIAVLGIDNAVKNRFTWGERRYITPQKYESLKRYTVRPNDVIVTIMGTTGRSAVVPEDIPTAITSKHLATLSLNRDLVEPEFIAQALHEHPGVVAQIEQANRGAIMSGLNLGIIRALTVRLPPLDVQRRFAMFTAKTRKLAQDNDCGLVVSDHLFSSLVDRAFRGELTAPSASKKKQLDMFDALGGE